MLDVLKIGGSLCKDLGALENLCHEIKFLSLKFDLLLIPGGGKFANLVREMDKKFDLKPEISHRMALITMDLNSILISNFFENFSFIYSLNEVGDRKGIKIFIPSRFILGSDIEPSWDVTSDSIAAFIAAKLNAEKLIILKDIDGIYTKDPKKDSDVSLLKEIDIKEISKLRDLPLDRKFPEFAALCNEIWILNGKFPERVRDVFEGKDAIGTRIVK